MRSSHCCYGQAMTTNAPRVAKDQVVAIRYTLTSQSGEILDQSGDSPLAYLHGYDNIVPGVERQLEGKAPGDKLRAVVLAERCKRLRLAPLAESLLSHIPS